MVPNDLAPAFLAKNSDGSKHLLVNFQAFSRKVLKLFLKNNSFTNKRNTYRVGISLLVTKLYTKEIIMVLKKGTFFFKTIIYLRNNNLNPQCSVKA